MVEISRFFDHIDGDDSAYNADDFVEYFIKGR